MSGIEVVPGKLASPAWAVAPMVSRDAAGIPLPKPVAAPAPVVGTPMDIHDALAWLSTMAGTGVLKGSSHREGLAALETVQPFLVKIRRALDRMGADEDYAILCEKDPEPHAMPFHLQHTEAP